MRPSSLGCRPDTYPTKACQRERGREKEKERERERVSARARIYILASKSSKASSKLAVKLVKMTNMVVNQTKVIKVGN